MGTPALLLLLLLLLPCCSSAPRPESFPAEAEEEALAPMPMEAPPAEGPSSPKTSSWKELCRISRMSNRQQTHPSTHNLGGG